MYMAVKNAKISNLSLQMQSLEIVIKPFFYVLKWKYRIENGPDVFDSVNNHKNINTDIRVEPTLRHCEKTLRFPWSLINRVSPSTNVQHQSFFTLISRLSIIIIDHIATYSQFHSVCKHPPLPPPLNLYC